MTPKEKAIELVDRYYKSFDLELDYLQSKQCALVAVDEMIEMLKELERKGFLKRNSAIPIIKEVKQEIEKL